MKKIELNADDIIITEIITKQEYTQNRIKLDIKYRAKELYNKIFLIGRGFASKIIFSNYLFAIRDILGIKEGVVIVADFKIKKNIFLLGILDNPLDGKSLLKVEFDKDKYYDGNILCFQNWIKFFGNKEKAIFIITNNSKEFKNLIEQQKLDDYKFKFIKKEDIEKINSSLKPVYIKEDLLSIYIPSLVIVAILYFVIKIITQNVIQADIDNSKKLKAEASAMYSQKTKALNTLENSDFYKNRDYYLKLAERKIYIKKEQ